MNHVDTVLAMYQAFGQADVPGILRHLAEDVEWEYGQVSTDVPWFQPRHGREQVVGFFQALAELDIQRFAPKVFAASGNTVIVLLDLEATVKRTGRRIVEEDEVHIWHFDDRGAVRRFRHRADTHQHWAALAADR